MKLVITTICMLFISALSFAQSSVSISDFEILNNTNWKGTLSYLDYRSGNQLEIEATMQIKIDGNKIKSNVQYTYEPHKNNKASVQIEKNGTYYGNEKIVSNSIKNNTRIIVTTYAGKDNGRKADFYKTHTFNKTTYSISKKVVFKDDYESLIRNTYKFKRIN
jgi:hypothetical protein